MSHRNHMRSESHKKEVAEVYPSSSVDFPDLQNYLFRSGTTLYEFRSEYFDGGIVHSTFVGEIKIFSDVSK